MPGSFIKFVDLPPAWLLLAMGLTWLAGRALPETILDSQALNAAGFCAMAGGIALMLWCGFLFRRRRTSIIPRNTPNAMIVDGPYRFSRNPIYLADAIILAGWIMVVGSPLALVTLPAFVLIINRRFIESEEAVLQREFGEAYATWSRNVRRWI